MTSVTARPHSAAEDGREDDGYFGPGSVTWRLFADPSLSLGGIAAILLQALNPDMMRLFTKVSDFYGDAAGRSERTGRYLETITYGDRAHADAAARSVRRMHAHARWVDPQTGQEWKADTESWQDWTHNTLVWSIVRAASLYGPALTDDERDRFVREQHASARLLGMDAFRLPSTWAELDAEVQRQGEHMALTMAANELARNLRKPSLKGNPVAVLIGVSIQDGILAILPEWARQLYGIEGRPMSLRAATRTTRRLLAVSRRQGRGDRAVVAIIQRVEEHPYRKVRKRRPVTP